MQCRDFREVADSYLGDELLVETNHDVLRHLESCADCRRELAARRDLRYKLRAAFAHDSQRQMSEDFAGRLRGQLRTLPPRRVSSHAAARRGAWLALAACLLLATTFGLSALRRQAGEPTQLSVSEQSGVSVGDKPDSPVTPNSQGTWRTVMAALSERAAGDHRHCAIKFRLAEKPIALDEAGRKYDRAYVNLAQTVLSQQAGGAGRMEILDAHSCVFEGRRFGHIVLKYQNHVVSLLVTDLEGPENRLAGASSGSTGTAQQLITSARRDGYEVSSFETARHAVFVVSDLSEADNVTVALSLAPALLAHITRAEQLV